VTTCKFLRKSPLFRPQKGFSLIELMAGFAIIAILAAISIPNYRLYKDKAEFASVRTTLKHLMDGEDAYLLENSTFYPMSGPISIPKEIAKDIPELAYSFPKGHKNSYTIWGYNTSDINYYYIYVQCDFDANNNGINDSVIVITYLLRGNMILNREFRQLQ